MKRARTIFSIAWTAIAGPVVAQQLESRPVPSRDVVSFTYQSPSMGVRYGINVGLPVDFRPAAGKKYPALITTDGDQQFVGVYQAARSLMSQRAIGEMFIVSIGSELEQGDSSWIRRRFYEFTPANWDLKDPVGQLILKVCETYRSAPDRCTGGAPKFLGAILTEMLPLIQTRYPIDPEQLGLFGISAGGFFATWTVFQAGSPFKKYLISSPALAYGNDEIFRHEVGYAAGHKDLDAAIYFGAGSLEILEEPYEAVIQTVSGMLRLGAVMRTRNYPSLKLVTEVHPGMGHADVVGTSVVRGLRSLYGSVRDLQR
jgi:predicted alpha/beta superfamily hydrolase